MVRRWYAAIVLGVVALACGPQAGHVAVCDDETATELLRLAATDVSRFESGVGVVDQQGWLFAVGGRGVAVECNDVAREFADDISVLYLPQAPGAPWIAGRREPVGAEFFVVDPWGESSPVALSGMPVASYDGDAVLVERIEDGVSPRIAFASTGDADEVHEVDVPYELPDPELVLADWPYLGTSVSEPSEVLFAAASNRRSGTVSTIQIDLATGSTSVLRDGYTPLIPRDGHRFAVLASNDPGSSALVLDMETGREIALGQPGWQPDAAWFRSGADATVVIAWAPDDADGRVARTHLVLLPDGQELWLDGDWYTEREMLAADGRRLLDGPDGLYVLERGASAPRLLHPSRGASTVHGSDAYLWDLGLGFCRRCLQWPPGRLVRVPLDGGPAEVLIEGTLWASLRLQDDRWAIMRSVDDEQRGDLLLFDPRTGAESVIAERVSRYYGKLNVSRTDSVPTAAPHHELLFAAPSSRGDGDSIWRLVP